LTFKVGPLLGRPWGRPFVRRLAAVFFCPPLGGVFVKQGGELCEHTQAQWEHGAGVLSAGAPWGCGYGCKQKGPVGHVAGVFHGALEGPLALMRRIHEAARCRGAFSCLGTARLFAVCRCTVKQTHSEDAMCRRAGSPTITGLLRLRLRGTPGAKQAVWLVNQRCHTPCPPAAQASEPVPDGSCAGSSTLGRCRPTRQSRLRSARSP
jgi:hypothetical protein